MHCLCDCICAILTLLSLWLLPLACLSEPSSESGQLCDVPPQHARVELIYQQEPDEERTEAKCYPVSLFNKTDSLLQINKTCVEANLKTNVWDSCFSPFVFLPDLVCWSLVWTESSHKWWTQRWTTVSVQALKLPSVISCRVTGRKRTVVAPYYRNRLNRRRLRLVVVPKPPDVRPRRQTTAGANAVLLKLKDKNKIICWEGKLYLLFCCRNMH